MERFRKNKKSISRGIPILLCGLLLTLVTPLGAYAATGTAISSVSLKISSSIEAGDEDSDVEVTTSSSKYEVEEVEVTNEPTDEWEDGDKPKLKVTLEAGDDYYFKSGFSKSSVSLSGSDGTVTSVSRTSSTLLVYITLDALDGDGSYELDVSDTEWNESTGAASWEGAEDAKYYELRLYRGSSAVASSLTTTSESYNFASYITTSGTYTFRVRAVYNSSNKGEWEESDSWYVTSDTVSGLSSSTASTPSASSSGGAWLLDEVGWWYCNADRSYTVSNWQYIDNNWYYFNETGYMVTGWVYWNTKWYYLSSSGAMLCNATTPDGYSVGGDGVWVQ